MLISYSEIFYKEKDFMFSTLFFFLMVTYTFSKDFFIDLVVIN